MCTELYMASYIYFNRPIPMRLSDSLKCRNSSQNNVIGPHDMSICVPFTPKHWVGQFHQSHRHRHLYGIARTQMIVSRPTGWLYKNCAYIKTFNFSASNLDFSSNIL